MTCEKVNFCKRLMNSESNIGYLHRVICQKGIELHRYSVYISVSLPNFNYLSSQFRRGVSNKTVTRVCWARKTSLENEAPNNVGGVSDAQMTFNVSGGRQCRDN